MTQDLRIHISADGIATVTSQLNQVNSSIQNVEKSGGFTSFRNGLAMTGLAIDAVVTNAKRLAGVGNYFIDPAAEIEQLKLRLESLYGSFDAGSKAFQTFQDVAAKTPASLIDVVNAGAQLKAFGADAEAMIAPMTDLAGYMGTTVVEAANSFGRAFAGGAGAADIFREKGINALIMSFNKLDTLEGVTLPKFREAMIKTFIDPAGGISGAADRMSKSYTGALSNMEDIWARVRAWIVSDMTKSLEEGFRSITKSLEDFIASGAAEKMAKQIAQITEAMIKVISIATRLDYVTVGIGAAFTAATVMVYRYRMGLLAANTQNAIMALSTFSLSKAIKAATYEIRFFMMALGPVGLAITAVGLAVTGGVYAFNNYSASSKQLTDDLEILKQKLAETRNETTTLVGALPKTGNNEYINGMVSGFQKVAESQEKAKKAAAVAAASAASFSVPNQSNAFIAQLQAIDAYLTATDNLSQKHIDYQLSLYRAQLEEQYKGVLTLQQIKDMVAIKNDELQAKALAQETDTTNAMKERMDAIARASVDSYGVSQDAMNAYYTATENMSNRHIELQLEIYRQDIELKYQNALTTIEIEKMVAAERLRLQGIVSDKIQQKEQTALDKLMQNNEVAAAIMGNTMSYIGDRISGVLELQTDTASKAMNEFNRFINSMISDLSRLIAKQLFSAMLNQLIASSAAAAFTGGGGGFLGFLGGLLGVKSTSGENRLSPVVGASQSNQTLTMAINRLNYNLEGGMQNNVNVYVKPRDIARANTVGQMQLVTL